MENKLSVGIPQDNKIKEFFDGLSLSILYFECILGNATILTKKDDYPNNIKNFTDYIVSFKSVICEEECAYHENPDFYDNYTRTIPKTLINSTQKYDYASFLESYLYMAYFNNRRIYIFCSNEPSNLFKHRINNILRFSDALLDIEEKMDEFIEAYKLPKAQLAVFNSNGFELPSDYAYSVVSTKEGDKHLDRQEEIELLHILKILAKTNENDKNATSWLSLFSKKRNSGYTLGNEGLWYYWAVHYPIKKYLAIKMIERFADENTENRFVDYTSKQIWASLSASKSLAEMKDWIDTFTQKDAGILADDKTSYVRLISTIKYFPYIIFIVLFSYIFALFDKSDQKLEEKAYLLDEKIELAQKTLQNQNNINFLIISLINDINIPFIFFPKARPEKITINDLSEEDITRLKRIANYFKDRLSPKDWTIIIMPYIGNKIDQHHNIVRAEQVKAFLITQNPQLNNTIHIQSELLQEHVYGVKIAIKSN